MERAWWLPGGLAVLLGVGGLSIAQTTKHLRADVSGRPRHALPTPSVAAELLRTRLETRFDLSGRTDPHTTMSGGTKKVPVGPTARLAEGITWEVLAAMSPAEMRKRDAFPYYPLERADLTVALPDAYLPESPPPLYLTTRPDLGDVSRGQRVTPENIEILLEDVLTPFQMEGLRLLLERDAPRSGFTFDPAPTKPDHSPMRNRMAMAHMESILDFPPAPKLAHDGRLDPALATAQELRGEVVFGRHCASCHPAPYYTDNHAHDLRVERFHARSHAADGPVRTSPLRGIKDTPPYFHDGRLLTLEDGVEFFDLVLGARMTAQEKADLAAFLKTL